MGTLLIRFFQAGVCCGPCNPSKWEADIWGWLEVRRSAILHYTMNQCPHWACRQYGHSGGTQGWLSVGERVVWGVGYIQQLKALLASKSGICWCTVLTHQRIPLLLAKSALHYWMYPTAQITLSPTPSHPWVPPEWPYCQQAQCGHWFTVKHSNACLQTSSHPQNSASHLLGLQDPSLMNVLMIKANEWSRVKNGYSNQWYQSIKTEEKWKFHKDKAPIQK